MNLTRFSFLHSVISKIRRFDRVIAIDTSYFRLVDLYIAILFLFLCFFSHDYSEFFLFKYS